MTTEMVAHSRLCFSGIMGEGVSMSGDVRERNRVLGLDQNTASLETRCSLVCNCIYICLVVQHSANGTINHN